jgi:hypothetical protein
MPAPVEKNPAGLMASLQISFDQQETIHIVTDHSWCVADQEHPQWQQTEFDDRRWTPAREMASAGNGPWGQIGARGHPWLIPYASGTPNGNLRLVYLPVSDPLVVHRLDPQGAYTAQWINPATGQRSDATGFLADASGNWRPTYPSGYRQDWLLAIRRDKAN